MRVFFGVLFLISSAAAVAQANVENAVQALLRVGFQSARVSPADLRVAYERELAQLGGPDARLDFAYSLVLRKNFAGKEGQEILEAAAASTAPIVFLAREELIDQLVRRRRYAEALLRVEQLAKVLGQVAVESPQAHEARRSAHWLGIVVAFLEDPLGIDKVQEQAQEVDANMQRLLGEHYFEQYQSGRLKVRFTQQQISGKVSEVQDEIAVQKDETLKQVTVGSQELQEKQTELQKLAKDFTDITSDSLADLNSKLTVLEKQLEVSLETEKMMLIRSTILRTELQQLYRDWEFATNVRTGTAELINLEGQIAARERELVLMSRDHLVLLGSRKQVVTLAEQLVAKRAAMSANFQNQANAARETMARLQRMQQTLNKTEKKATEDVNESRQVKAAQKKLKDFSSYSESSLELRRQLLLKSFLTEAS